MSGEEDFVKDDEIELEVQGFKKGDWKYRLMNAGQDMDWLNDYLEVDKDGKARVNRGKILKNKLTYNLTKIPYTKEIIKKIVGEEKSWEKLDIKNREKFINKLKPNINTAIIQAIQKAESEDEETKNL